MKMKLPCCMCIAITAAACGPHADRATTIDNAPAAHDAHPAVTPCPAGEELSELARSAWQKGEGTVTAECVAAWIGGESVWLVDGSFEPAASDTWTVGLWTALVTPGGQVRWSEGDDEYPASTLEKMYSGEFRAIDLDADGSDEILFENHYSSHGYDESYLLVWRMAGGKLEIAQVADGVEDMGVPLETDNSAADVNPDEIISCMGTYQVDGSTIAVTYTGQCDRASARYRYDGQRLVKE